MRKYESFELDRKSVDDFRNSQKAPFVIVLDSVRSALNVGSMFRSADALMCEAIYLCGITACPPNKEIMKTALGATESVEWKYFPHAQDALQELIENGYEVWAVEQAEGSTLLTDFAPAKDAKFAFVFGNEVNGVDQALIDQCGRCLEIPQFGTKHSFNVAVSAGIVLWDAFRKWYY